MTITTVAMFAGSYPGFRLCYKMSIGDRLGWNLSVQWTQIRTVKYKSEFKSERTFISVTDPNHELAKSISATLLTRSIVLKFTFSIWQENTHYCASHILLGCDKGL